MKDLRTTILFALMICVTAPIWGQDYDLSTPEGTVKALFKAMYEGDSTLARKVFVKEPALNSVFTTKDGKLRIQDGDLSGFIQAIGTPHDQVWDERIANLKVNEDADLAQVWMDYSFYLGDKFSHCGVNAMHMIRMSGEWKIYQLVDTRRKSDCNN